MGGIAAKGSRSVGSSMALEWTYKHETKQVQWKMIGVQCVEESAGYLEQKSEREWLEQYENQLKHWLEIVGKFGHSHTGQKGVTWTNGGRHWLVRSFRCGWRT